MAFDVFGDAATRGYLRNVAASNDMEVVKRLEHASFLDNVGTAMRDLSKVEKISYADVLQTHKTLFSDVYPWAGEDRQRHAPESAITKGGMDMFAHPRDVVRATEYALRQGQNKEFMAEKPGEVMGSLAYAHPFLDGNGRTIMIVHAELAQRAGISIQWERTDKAEYLNALTQELHNPGQGELDRYLKPFVEKVGERETLAATLKVLPGLGPQMNAPASASETAAVKDEDPQRAEIVQLLAQLEKLASKLPEEGQAEFRKFAKDYLQKFDQDRQAMTEGPSEKPADDTRVQEKAEPPLASPEANAEQQQQAQREKPRGQRPK